MKSLPLFLKSASLLISAFVICAATIYRTQHNSTPAISIPVPIDTSSKTIHIFVALCDNKYQGIVPVPAKIGNGQDLGNNLYWGCGYGIRTFFKNSKEWKLLRTQKPDTIKLERLVFKHRTKNYYLIADAYNGKYIKKMHPRFFTCKLWR